MRSVNFQQGANTAYPLIVYEVPLSSSQVPEAAVTSFLGFSACKSYTFHSDMLGRGALFSPKEGTLNSLGEWTTGNTFPTTSLDVPHVMRSFLFRKVDAATNGCPLIGEISFRVRFMIQKFALPGVSLGKGDLSRF